jgi:hypothetical protein
LLTKQHHHHTGMPQQGQAAAPQQYQQPAQPPQVNDPLICDEDIYLIKLQHGSGL